MSLEKNGDVGI